MNAKTLQNPEDGELTFKNASSRGAEYLGNLNTGREIKMGERRCVGSIGIAVLLTILIFTCAFAELTDFSAQVGEIEGKAVGEEEETKLPPILIYDEKNLLEISIEDIGKYHGDICPCVVIGFRATRLAISKLWGDEIPKRNDFEVISKSPTLGTQDAFDFITRAKTGMNRQGDFRIELPKGTNFENLSRDNFVFVFIRKSTGDSIEIRIKEEVFPEGHFELRKKVKSKRATRQEKEAFKSTQRELKYRLMNLPSNELFISGLKASAHPGGKGK